MNKNEEFQKKFPDEREKNQNQTLLRQAQLIELRILKIVDYICKKHKIKYFLEGGTLIGAVRHKGFIPWDDDIDISMPRKEYNRFIKIAKDELPDDLFMQNFRTTQYAGNTWTQIRDRKSRIVLEKNAKYHEGIYIDIFSLDSYSNNKFKNIFYERIFKLLYINVQAINAPFKKPYLVKINIVKNLIKLILKIVFFPFAIFNHKVIYNLNLKTREKRIKKMKKNKNDNYGYGTDVLNFDTIWKSETIFPLKKLKFEDGEFNVPGNYDSFLTHAFGDYMKMPPKNKRIFHNKGIKPILTKEEEKRLNKGFYYDEK